MNSEIVDITHDDENNHVDEHTPLLQRAWNTPPSIFTIISVFSIFFIFTLGLFIGMFLLITQDEEWPVNSTFDMIPREGWNANPPRNVSKLHKPVHYLVITHTITDDCITLLYCKRIVYDFQKTYQDPPYNMVDLPFNFMIGNDGKTYEGRGWNVISEVNPQYDKDSISVGLIGNFTEKKPSLTQLNELRALIIESILHKKLLKAFKLAPVSFNNVSLNWDNKFDKILK